MAILDLPDVAMRRDQRLAWGVPTRTACANAPAGRLHSADVGTLR
jgi:hypothetical protein